MYNEKCEIDFIKGYAASKGYKLLSTEYVNSKTKLIFKCPDGHEFPMKWNDFQQGHRCPEHTGHRKKTIEEIREYVESKRHKLLSDVYINSKAKLLLKSPQGEEFLMSWNRFQKGARCPRHNNKGELNSNWRGGVSVLGIPLYDTYASKIEFCEEVRRDPNNEDWLQVRCTNCNKWLSPNVEGVRNRLKGVDDNKHGECRFYCSDECKHSCPIFGQHKFPKGFKPEPTRDSALQREWRNLLLEERGYKCEKCGRTDVPIFAHHIDPVKCAPMFATDLDNGILLCEECHDGAHSLPNCSTTELRNYEFDPTSIYL